MPSKDMKILLEREVRVAYDDRQRHLKQLKDVVRERIERELAAETQADLIAFSKKLHEYHAKGLSKAALKRATRKYSNQHEWDKLWDAYTPEGGVEALSTQTSRVVNDLGGGLLEYVSLPGVTLAEPATIKDVKWSFSQVDNDYIPSFGYVDTATWKRVQSNRGLIQAIQDDLVAHTLGEKPATEEEAMDYGDSIG